MDDWDKDESVESRPRFRKERKCDFTDTLRVHIKGSMMYHSLFKTSKEGTPFGEIKQSEEIGTLMAQRACRFLDMQLTSYEGWCVVTTPRRRHFENFNFSEFVSGLISKYKSITFYKGAVQCINKDRLNPQFHLLRPIEEKKVILFDDIITTGTTLKATRELLTDKEQVICIVGIQNK